MSLAQNFRGGQVEPAQAEQLFSTKVLEWLSVASLHLGKKGCHWHRPDLLLRLVEACHKVSDLLPLHRQICRYAKVTNQGQLTDLVSLSTYTTTTPDQLLPRKMSCDYFCVEKLMGVLALNRDLKDKVRGRECFVDWLVATSQG